MIDEFTRGWPYFSDDEIAAVQRVLRSGRVNYWTGEEVRDFEASFADFVDARFAIALANGTVALELALRALGIGPGDDVVVTSRSFVASAGAASLVGATPVFADVDRDSQNITAETIEAALTNSTRAIIVVHLGGWPCEMDPIMQLAAERDLLVVEDCAQALGAAVEGKPVGSWGHAATWSFCQDKIMTTGGEGGMLTTNDAALFDRAWSFKDHGKNRHKTIGARPGPTFRWLHDSVGTNWRMTEMQAAIGEVALPKVPGWIERRRAVARLFDNHFGQHEAFRVTVPPQSTLHAYYKYYVFVRPDQLPERFTRDDLLQRLHERGIPAFTGICGEIYRERAFEDAGFAPSRRHPVARELAETSIMIPVHPRLSDESVSKVAEAVTAVVSEAI